MENSNLEEILEFAIQREHEAAEFYRKLVQMSRFKNQKETFKEFEKMEMGHASKLTNFKDIDVEAMEVPEVTDLKISDYLVKSRPAEDMSYQDIIVTAMKREEKSHNLYKRLADEYKAPKAKKLFEKLASEEAKHKLHFEKIYDEEVLQDN